jgi:flavodoxin
MYNRKILTVFYSKSGNTKTIAEAIAKLTGSEIEQITDTITRQGILGYLRCAFEGLFKRLTPIKETTKDQASYDLVIIGTPVWFGSVSSPIRTYLIQNRHRFRNVAFFCTYGGQGSIRTFGQMTDLVGTNPIVTLGVREKEMAGGDYKPKVEKFIKELRSKEMIGAQGA